MGCAPRREGAPVRRVRPDGACCSGCADVAAGFVFEFVKNDIDACRIDGCGQEVSHRWLPGTLHSRNLETTARNYPAGATKPAPEAATKATKRTPTPRSPSVRRR